VKKEKNKYMVDASNRLTIRHGRKNMPIKGRFNVDGNNQLSYRLSEPMLWRKKNNLPNKISFQGNWQINPNYDLALILDETKSRQEGDRLTLKGDIISVDRDTLVFEINSRDKYGQSHIQLLKLAGFWQADSYNRLCFVIKKKTTPDVLTLEGIWQLNQAQQIKYTYEKTDLKTKRKISHTLSFEGFWQINSCNRLTYILSRSQDSRFDFRVQAESPNLYPKDKAIRYRLGIGFKKGREIRSKIISLYGAWKFSRDFGLIFQMDYGKNKLRNIEFSADFNMEHNNKVIFLLKDKFGEALGINITFSHKFLKQNGAEAFLKLRSSKSESCVETGVRVPF
jgi:hypothetical protein